MDQLERLSSLCHVVALLLGAVVLDALAASPPVDCASLRLHIDHVPLTSSQTALPEIDTAGPSQDAPVAIPLAVEQIVTTRSEVGGHHPDVEIGHAVQSIGESLVQSREVIHELELLVLHRIRVVDDEQEIDLVMLGAIIGASRRVFIRVADSVSALRLGAILRAARRVLVSLANPVSTSE
jgi:hypothetical protein